MDKKVVEQKCYTKNLIAGLENLITKLPFRTTQRVSISQTTTPYWLQMVVSNEPLGLLFYRYLANTCVCSVKRLA